MSLKNQCIKQVNAGTTLKTIQFISVLFEIDEFVSMI